MSNSKRILIFVDWFEPGFKAGGPIRSCVNFVWHMKENYEISIFTSDRDMGSLVPYAGIIVNKWINYTNRVKIYYASPSHLSWSNIDRQIKEVNPSFIYINSMFSKYFSVYPLLMKRTGRITAKIILAPRGMLKGSALYFKSTKKSFFLLLLKLSKMSKHISFHATDENETTDIKKQIGGHPAITCIPNYPGFQNKFTEPPGKNVNELKMVFVGRIHPIKNLYLLLQCLMNITASIQMTIVGSVEDSEYWFLCEQLISQLPLNITVNLMRDVPHNEIEAILTRHHLFALLTAGENFGHAIFEALAAGRPVLISDQTPWKNLQVHGAGWDIPLTEQHKVINSINSAAAMDHGEVTNWCLKAWQYCNDYIHKSGIQQQYFNLFR